MRNWYDLHITINSLSIQELIEYRSRLMDLKDIFKCQRNSKIAEDIAIVIDKVEKKVVEKAGF